MFQCRVEPFTMPKQILKCCKKDFRIFEQILQLEEVGVVETVHDNSNLAHECVERLKNMNKVRKIRIDLNKFSIVM